MRALLSVKYVAAGSRREGCSMKVRKLFLGMAAASAVLIPLSALAATETSTTEVGTAPGQGPGPAYFFITNGTPFTPSITANFGNTISGADTSFDDFFTFTIPQNGVGSGSLSTSFSAASNMLTIDDVIIDGTRYSAAQAADGISGVPIEDDVKNTIEVQGVTGESATAATYSGTATFAAVSSAPEPSAWLLMFAGIGFIGAFLRRRTGNVQFA